ncbi:hypothetical protein SKAU_G00169710 [Synaphobranchus kaupii]|uniref:Uncharacterized protein n=1 Tax=Synaphobranchus kaupii TaxID=118154 RepID=A0A9Q1FKA8_SYNKA|nr:hypothetical protein SKAU_G00169710 [Synaphobranchus kaupii]
MQPRGDRLTLTSGNDTYHSEYRCRGNRTGKPSYTEISIGCVPAHKISRVVENLARVGVGVAILLFLSVILNEGLLEEVGKQTMFANFPLRPRLPHLCDDGSVV